MTKIAVQQHQQAAPNRPTKYTEEIGTIICDRLAEDESLSSICADPKMPDVATVSDWLAHNQQFRDAYALAIEWHAMRFMDEIKPIIDEVLVSVERVRANGRVRRGLNREALRGWRLRIEVRHWVVERLLDRSRALSTRTYFALDPPAALPPRKDL